MIKVMTSSSREDLEASDRLKFTEDPMKEMKKRPRKGSKTKEI